MAHLLIADDQPETLRAVVAYVNRHGHTVEQHLASTDLAPVLAGSHFDAAILDHRFPEGQPTGLQVAREARHLGFRGPIVLLTGYPDSIVPDEAAVLDVTVIAKGDAQHFENVMREVLRYAHAERLIDELPADVTMEELEADWWDETTEVRNRTIDGLSELRMMFAGGHK